VPRYYDANRPPSDEEMQLTNGMLPQWIAQDSLARAGLGVRQWIGGISARDALIEYLFNTTMNVDGMWAGYTGPGMKTILPHIATAKMDSRLVPDQDPDSALTRRDSLMSRSGS
jgi:acetylornithine deacetylase/succinyl-diaminopimelate desuccinylase-like protein